MSSNNRSRNKAYLNSTLEPGNKETATLAEIYDINECCVNAGRDPYKNLII